MNTPVIQDWLTALTLKQQTVLLSAIRGCDGVGKHDLSKKFVRFFRSQVLKDACPVDTNETFMKDTIAEQDIYDFTKSMDHYPMHWLFHFLHAVEIVGYNHPEKEIQGWFNRLYHKMVDALHLFPEPKYENSARLMDGVPSHCWKS